MKHKERMAFFKQRKEFYRMFPLTGSHMKVSEKMADNYQFKIHYRTCMKDFNGNVLGYVESLRKVME